MPVKNKGRHARTKGHSFERELANKLKVSGVFPDAKRHLEMQASEAKGYDLDNTGPYRIQCKRYKKYAPITAIEEIKDEHGTIPVLVTKPDHKPAMAVIPLDHFIDLLLAENELTYTPRKKRATYIPKLAENETRIVQIVNSSGEVIESGELVVIPDTL